MKTTEAVLIRDIICVLRGVIETAVTESPEEAVNVVADYFEDCGVDDEETRKILDIWWSGNAVRRRQLECEKRQQE